MITGERRILHVEDDPGLSWIVSKVFESFGFGGTMIRAESVRRAHDILYELERAKQSLSLIISDMRLNDGSGLDLIREVKMNPYWRMTPVIVLSGERDPSIINAAYALGASSFLPKTPQYGNLVISLESFYKCWLEYVELPRESGRDILQETLDKACSLRARTSEFYLNLARGVTEDAGTFFWLDRALAEGNLSNLFAFFRGRLSHGDVPPEVIDRISSYQAAIVEALREVESQIRKTPAPDDQLRCRWVLMLTDALDEKVFIDALTCLLPKGPAVTVALKACAAAQMKALAGYVMERTTGLEERQKAVALMERSVQLESEALQG